jgi:hypothetical protein
VVKLAVRRIGLAVCLALPTLLAGCLYPQEQTPGNGAPVHGSVMAIQDAVTRYKESMGVLPIMNADETVPRYEKYKIDFGKMKRTGYIESIPRHAFENGGPYVFLLIDEEDEPRVKLLDAAVHQAIADVQKKVAGYMRSRGGEIPAGPEAYPGFHYLDFGKLGMDPPEIRSMFSRRPLELMADAQGTVYADYGIDIAEAMEKTELPAWEAEDLRGLLVEASDFVPVKSPVYRLVDGRPQAVAVEAAKD